MKKVEGCPQPLGVTIEQEKVNFAVSVPRGESCELLLYRTGKTEPVQVYEMPEEEGLGEVRFLAVEGLTVQRYEYNYRIGGQVVVDPYVRELARTKKFGEKPEIPLHQVRGRILNLLYDWEGDRRPNLSWNEVIAYSLHVRGFTKHTSSKVTHRGTFSGIVEKLPYLQELGINQIQCMPVYEFEERCRTCQSMPVYESEERCRTYQNYWGYGSGYYFAPKAAYSVSGHAVQELKDMVKACHRAGIEVVLEMPFTPEISQQMALECLKYYMLEYHIDGFLLNPYHVSMEGLEQDPLLKGVKLLHKEECFQNIMRRFLKGDDGMVESVIGALRYHTGESGACNYLTAHTGFTLYDLVSYEQKHNEANGEQNQDGPDYNYSWNCGVEGPTRKRTVTELRKRQIRNAFLLLLLAQGTPCILAGDEFWNTQKGNNNVYCQDNETAWLDWNGLKKDGTLFQDVKRWIAFRKKHPALCQKQPLLGTDRTACGVPDVSYHGDAAWQVPSGVYSRQLGVMYCGGEKQHDFCFVAYNMHWMKHSFALPVLPGERKWYRVIETTPAAAVENKRKGKSGEQKQEVDRQQSVEDRQGQELPVEQKQIELAPRSIVVLVGR